MRQSYGNIHYYQGGRVDLELFPPWAEPGEKSIGHYAVWDAKTGTTEVVPRSITEYRTDPARWTRVRGIAPMGAVLKLTRVELVQTFETHWYEYFAVFLDGPFAGEQFVLNNIWRDLGEYLQPTTAK